MMITIPAATPDLPPVFFHWLAVNGVEVPQVSGATPVYINDQTIGGHTVLGSEFTRAIVVPLDDYLSGYLLNRFGEHDAGTSVLDDMASLVQQLAEARQAEKDAKARAEEARDQILSRLRIEGSSVGTVGGRPAVQLKVVESKRLDTARLRREQPDIADIYTSVSTSERLELL